MSEQREHHAVRLVVEEGNALCACGHKLYHHGEWYGCPDDGCTHSSACPCEGFHIQEQAVCSRCNNQPTSTCVWCGRMPDGRYWDEGKKRPMESTPPESPLTRSLSDLSDTINKQLLTCWVRDLIDTGEAEEGCNIMHPPEAPRHLP